MADSSDATRTLAAILTEHGPLSTEDLAQRLGEAGISDPDAVIEEYLDDFRCPVGELPDGRWVWLPTLLTGRVFAHRVTAPELTHDLLAICPDLDPIVELCHHDGYRGFADGSQASIVLPDFDELLLEQRGIPVELVDESGALLLKPGTMAGLGVSAGDLVGLRWSDDGFVAEPVTASADPSVGTRLAALLDAEEPLPFTAVVWAACADDADLFGAPLAPLGEIADEHGLAHTADLLAPNGFDIERWKFDRKCARMAARHDLDSDDAFVLTTLVEMHSQMAQLLDLAMDAEEAMDTDDAVVETPADAEPADGQYTEILGELGAALADPLLALSFMEEATRDGRRGAAALGMFAESLESKVPRSARAATRWLKAMACEHLGDIAGSERELLAAESLDPDWQLTLFGLARIASDRGDTETGLGLLHRAGASPDYPLVHVLEQHRTQPRNDIGRNEPCWCGSGRKYKKCHLGNEQLSLPDRVGWLYGKAHQQLLYGKWSDWLPRIGYQRIQYVEDQVDDLVAAAMTDPLAIDTMLFEGGAFAEFLELRGELLPDDERQLAEQWLGVPRSVFEVEQVRAGHGVTVRDVRTGEVLEVTERGPALQRGQLICSRALPTGDGFTFFGGIDPVEPQEQEALFELLDDEPDPVELVGFLSRRFDDQPDE